MASAKAFNNGKVDKNGLSPVGLLPLSGTSPRGINVISGTSAELYDIEVGTCYAIRADELSTGDKGYNDDAKDKHGNPVKRQFQFTMLAPLDTFQAVQAGIKSPAKVLITANGNEEGATVTDKSTVQVADGDVEEA